MSQSLRSLYPPEQLADCPCCHGQQWLRVHTAEFPDEPPQRMLCCHCHGEGVVALDRDTSPREP